MKDVASTLINFLSLVKFTKNYAYSVFVTLTFLIMRISLDCIRCPNQLRKKETKFHFFAVLEI